MRNAGPASAAWLASVGIRGIDELRAVGVVDAYELLRAHGYNVTLDLARALAGALLDRDWHDLPASVREDLRNRLGKVR